MATTTRVDSRPSNTIKKIGELNEIYHKANEADNYIFAEQRSNVLLANGDHYHRKYSRYWGHIRDTRQLSNDQRIRLTKNHIHHLIKTYINNVATLAPGVTMRAKNEKELQDQKAAELHKSVWEDIKERLNLKRRNLQFIDDFFTVGEVAAKIYWDPFAGKIFRLGSPVGRER